MFPADSARGAIKHTTELTSCSAGLGHCLRNMDTRD